MLIIFFPEIKRKILLKFRKNDILYEGYQRRGSKPQICFIWDTLLLCYFCLFDHFYVLNLAGRYIPETDGPSQIYLSVYFTQS